MSPDIMQNIFNPFFTIKKGGTGIGLGLSVASGIITSHNGIIKVESETGKGSQFEINLPITNK